MLAQTLIVGVLVLGCALYATWTLMPSGTRRHLARHLLKVSLPAAIRARVLRHAQATSGCGCDGCDHGTKAPASTQPKPLQFHRHIPR